jgi:hypothetical protein
MLSYGRPEAAAMASSKFVKTPKLHIVLQLTDTSGDGGRSWEAHDVERNRGFRVRLGARALEEAPSGAQRLGRPFTDAEIEGALGLAVERVLVDGGEKVPGPLYDVSVTSDDLYAFLALRT